MNYRSDLNLREIAHRELRLLPRRKLPAAAVAGLLADGTRGYLIAAGSPGY